jgi:HEPN domain-containing protein
VSAPLDEPEFGRWRADADAALRAARASAGAGVHNWACFQCEQAAQLALKAVLHGVGAGPWGHDLEGLGQQAEAAGVELGDQVRAALRRLARLYIPARYADAHAAGPAAAHYDAGDVEQALRDAGAVLEAVDRAWEVGRHA